MLIGPSGLSLLSHVIEIQTIAHFGSIFILFSHGLSYNNNGRGRGESIHSSNNNNTTNSPLSKKDSSTSLFFPSSSSNKPPNNHQDEVILTTTLEGDEMMVVDDRSDEDEEKGLVLEEGNYSHHRKINPSSSSSSSHKPTPPPNQSDSSLGSNQENTTTTNPWMFTISAFLPIVITISTFFSSLGFIVNPLSALFVAVTLGIGNSSVGPSTISLSNTQVFMLIHSSHSLNLIILFTTTNEEKIQNRICPYPNFFFLSSPHLISSWSLFLVLFIHFNKFSLSLLSNFLN